MASLHDVARLAGVSADGLKSTNDEAAHATAAEGA